jgi:hypothetical protein
MSARRLWMALVLITSLFSVRQLCSQETSHGGEGELYAGYGFLSDSFNDYAEEFSATPMNGWDAAMTLHAKGTLSISVEAMGFYATNLDASQFEHTVLVGPQWSRRAGKESLFAHGLIGMGFINSGAIPFDNSSPSSNVTFAALAGGGLDTPISPHLAWRIEGDYLRCEFGSKSDQIHNLRGNFAHFTTGIVFRF